MPARAAWPEAAAIAAVLAVIGGATAALVRLAPGQLGLALLLCAAALLLVALGLRHPLLACIYLLVTTFFRLAIPTGTLPVDPFLLAFVGLLAATWLWRRPPKGGNGHFRPQSWERRLATVRLDPITVAISLYLAWNLLSLVLPHSYPAAEPLDPAAFSVSRFVVIGVVIPLLMFPVGRRLFVTEHAIRVLLWSMLVAAGYSAAVSILQFSAPQWVWPGYILENTTWPGRAVGVFNTPVVNGLVLIFGFLVAVHLASHDGERPVLRACAAVVGAAGVYGIYLTHTRAVWLAFALVLVIGAVVARGFRTGFVLTALAMAGAVGANWSAFTSADRSAGGVGSVNEIEDRLNTIATSFRAFVHEPVTGWGIGRFAQVNTHHHQQWSPAIPWERGFGIPSHLDALGILVELGIIGLGLWLAVYGLLYAGLIRAIRRLPAGGPYGRALGLTALLCLSAQTITGLTVDLRFFDFPNIVVMLLAGAAIGWERERARRSRAEVAARAPTAAPDAVPARKPVPA